MRSSLVDCSVVHACVMFIVSGSSCFVFFFFCVFFFQAEDGIRDLVRSRGLGDVYKRQTQTLEKIKW